MDLLPLANFKVVGLCLELMAQIGSVVFRLAFNQFELLLIKTVFDGFDEVLSSTVVCLYV